MSWSLFPFSLEGDRSHDLDIKYLILIYNGTFEGWFGCIMVGCLVNFAIGPAVKLNQDPHKSEFGLSQEKLEVWPQPTHLSTAWDEVELFLCI